MSACCSCSHVVRALKWCLATRARPSRSRQLAVRMRDCTVCLRLRSAQFRDLATACRWPPLGLPCGVECHRRIAAHACQLSHGLRGVRSLAGSIGRCMLLKYLQSLLTCVSVRGRFVACRCAGAVVGSAGVRRCCQPRRTCTAHRCRPACALPLGRARVRPKTATPPHTGCSYRIARVRVPQKIYDQKKHTTQPAEGSNLGQIAAVHGFVSGGASCASARMRSRMLSRKSSRMLSSGCERCYGCCGGDCCGGGECSVPRHRRRAVAVLWRRFC